jgi:DNA polymerase III subunit delta'
MTEDWDDDDVSYDSDDNGAASAQTHVQALPIIGHDEAEQQILAAYSAGRLHHAWLLTGPMGVGKASFARRVARFLLSPARAEDGGGLFGPAEPTSLDVPQDDPASALIDAGSHPGFLLFERLVNEKTGKRATGITVDQARALGPFTALTASDGGWRVILVDAMDDMNRSAANAVLKILEEPPAKTIFLLISHQPGGLLPTIRSRCRRLEFKRLSDADVKTVLVSQLVASGDIAVLLALADGSPGQALRFAGLDLPPLASAIEAAMAGTLTPADRLTIAEQLGKSDAAPRYEAFLDLTQRQLADALRQRARQGSFAPMAVWEQVQALVGPALVLNDDAKAIVFQTLGLLSSVRAGSAAA